jgi:hypothetical protein
VGLAVESMPVTSKNDVRFGWSDSDLQLTKKAPMAIADRIFKELFIGKVVYFELQK